MVTLSSILACEIPWTEEPDSYSPWGHKELNLTEHIDTTHSLEVKWSEVTHSCLTFCYPMDWSLPGSSVHGIFQERVLEWVAISFSWGLVHVKY